MLYKGRIVIFMLLMCCTFLGGCNKNQTDDGFAVEDTTSEITQSPDLEEDSLPGTIFVYVCGAVKRSDVYELPTDARIIDAIKAAGGFTSKASKTSINQAKKLTDQEQVYVPTQEEVNNTTKTDSSMLSSGKNGSTLIDLNKATKEQLMTLPGIGESKADLIISYRQENGSFSSIEDIMKIQGIKDRVFQNIKELITID